MAKPGSPVRPLREPFVLPPQRRVAIRTRLFLSESESAVLRRAGAHLGSLAARDLARRCRDGLGHDSADWARRKRDLTPECSARWAGAITRANNAAWTAARRGQAQHLSTLRSAIG